MEEKQWFKVITWICVYYNPWGSHAVLIAVLMTLSTVFSWTDLKKPPSSFNNTFIRKRGPDCNSQPALFSVMLNSWPQIFRQWLLAVEFSEKLVFLHSCSLHCFINSNSFQANLSLSYSPITHGKASGKKPEGSRVLTNFLDVSGKRWLVPSDVIYAWPNELGGDQLEVFICHVLHGHSGPVLLLWQQQQSAW